MSTQRFTRNSSKKRFARLLIAVIRLRKSRPGSVFRATAFTSG
jgi:hypothetical protein